MKFTLREIFLVVLIVALALGWVLEKTVYHRQFTALDRLNGALWVELGSKHPARHVRINVSCGGVEKKYGYDELPLKD